jgi:hypothetical protein
MLRRRRRSYPHNPDSCRTEFPDCGPAGSVLQVVMEARATQQGSRLKRRARGCRKPVKCTSGVTPENGWQAVGTGGAAEDGEKLGG